MTTLPPALPPVCSQQQQGETRPEYAARVLRFLLAHDQTGMLSVEQLEQADMAAQRTAAQLPTKLEAADRLVDERLRYVRHRIAAALKWRTEQHRAAEAARQEHQQASQDARQDTTGPQAGQPVESDADRAVRLLRAALSLIVQPPRRDDDGGRGARLIKPVPSVPPGGAALRQPGRPATPGDGIDF